MESAQSPIVVRGLNRLLHEIVAQALSSYDWRPTDRSLDGTGSKESVEIALVFSHGQESDINAVRLIHTEIPTAKIVIAGGQENAAEVIRLVEEGISACVPEGRGLMDLVETLQDVRNNRARCAGSVTRLVLKRISSLSHQEFEADGHLLTSREQEVLHLISDGFSNKEIASRLRITPNTVKNHVHHLLEKLKVNSRHEAAWRQARTLSHARPDRQVSDVLPAFSDVTADKGARLSQRRAKISV
jgi:DNA-binding NarL/FixJ family response regulator